MKKLMNNFYYTEIKKILPMVNIENNNIFNFLFLFSLEIEIKNLHITIIIVFCI